MDIWKKYHYLGYFLLVLLNSVFYLEYDRGNDYRIFYKNKGDYYVIVNGIKHNLSLLPKERISFYLNCDLYYVFKDCTKFEIIKNLFKMIRIG